MSGTSADGIDAALVEFKADEITLIGFISPPLPAGLKQQLIQLNETPKIHLEQLCQLSFELAQQFTQTSQALLAKYNSHTSDITAIGSHGQTIYHAPQIPMSLQIGHPALIAKQTKIQTVGDFRVDDMALGGQGAPFAPAFHQALFKSSSDRFVVNIGGIANISYLPAQTENSTKTQPNPKGFDTGPGNALMDSICQSRFNQPYDDNGTLAQAGTVNTELLNSLLAHPYFSQPHPKSTGRETFNETWLTRCIEQTFADSDSTDLSTLLSDEDLISTLCELTAITLSQAITQTDTEHLSGNLPREQASESSPIKVWIVGGGAYNPTLIKRIQHHLPNFNVQSSQACGLNPNAIEAMMFAWFAKQRIAHQTVPLSHVTGASRDAILGAVWLP
ncbi:MAG: anhydro-N-acetylmuramic acid kinase [Gammaproteobacteria bacterium]|nr:anhydro-N-acetylmuramic acid kinase [Gammaproteobacteria bacterium]